MTSERKLRKWRREALEAEENRPGTTSLYEDTCPNLVASYHILQLRILTLTQELLDHHLLKKGDHK